jgi:6-phosphogluconolactonase
MAFHVEVFAGSDYFEQAGARVAMSLPGRGAVVLTGGSTAAGVYPNLARGDQGWGELEIFFSDERCVPPDDERSNFRMAQETLLTHVSPGGVHRMRGEDAPAKAAAAYAEAVAPFVERRLDLVLLGMGADCHIAGMFPRSRPLHERHALCLPVDRPDGLWGLTLTPPALMSSRRILVIVEGAGKAEAVERALLGDEDPTECPVRTLAGHPDVTFVLDDRAALALPR